MLLTMESKTAAHHKLELLIERAGPLPAVS